MVHHMGFAFNATLYTKVNYDTRRDIVPVALIGSTPNALVVTNSLPVKDVKEFLALARAKPGTINYGSIGAGQAAMNCRWSCCPRSTCCCSSNNTPRPGSGRPDERLQIPAQACSPCLRWRSYLQAVEHAFSTQCDLAIDFQIPLLDLPCMFGTTVDTVPYPARRLKSSTSCTIVWAKCSPTRRLPPSWAAIGNEAAGVAQEQFAGMVDADIARWGRIIKSLACYLARGSRKRPAKSCSPRAFRTDRPGGP